ncbi:MAG: sialidase family protein [Acidimicrobiales bacterium]
MLVVATSATSASAFANPEWSTSVNPISVGPITNISEPCTGQNAEVEQAIDPAGARDVYDAWMGCQGIGFAYSTNRGASFSTPVQLPRSDGTSDDPSVAVGPTGTVYVAFMVSVGDQSYPVVDASFNHGASFPQVTSIIPTDPENFGDSPNLAVGPDGTLYITWAYGPSNDSVILRCKKNGSCSFSSGELNVVIQKSTDSGRTFSTMVSVNPDYPVGGADNGPIVVGPEGQLDVLYQRYPTNPKTLALSPAQNYFTSSDNGGATWSTPVVVGPDAGTMSLGEWWNEPGLGIDSAGNLYAAWDTQGKTSSRERIDTGWLSYSEDGGAQWSRPVQAPSNKKNYPHIMEVIGAGPGQAYAGWLSDDSPRGYSLYVRPFSITSGWLARPRRISELFGSRSVWPGDTFGLSIFDSDHLITTWGSAATNRKDSAIYAAEETMAS